MNLVKILMQLDNPDWAIKDSIISAIQWFEASKIEGIKIIRVYDKKYEIPKTIFIKEDPESKKHKAYHFKGRGYDKIVAKFEGRPIWARFYDIDTQLPIFVGWDGEKKSSLEQIDYERRTGYLWYGYWPEDLLKYDWPKWKKKWID